MPVLEDMQTLLRDKVRNRANDMLLQQQLNNRMNLIDVIIDDIKCVIEETLCPLTTCLFENQTMQMAAEEQDEIDRIKIALYGQSQS